MAESQTGLLRDCAEAREVRRKAQLATLEADAPKDGMQPFLDISSLLTLFKRERRLTSDDIANRRRESKSLI